MDLPLEPGCLAEVIEPSLAKQFSEPTVICLEPVPSYAHAAFIQDFANKGRDQSARDWIRLCLMFGADGWWLCQTPDDKHSQAIPHQFLRRLPPPPAFDETTFADLVGRPAETTT